MFLGVSVVNLLEGGLPFCQLELTRSFRFAVQPPSVLKSTYSDPASVAELMHAAHGEQEQPT